MLDQFHTLIRHPSIDGIDLLIIWHKLDRSASARDIGKRLHLSKSTIHKRISKMQAIMERDQ